MAGALLFDLGDAPACHCDSALEHLFKAMAVDPAGDADHSMWAPHPNPALTFHVEDLTRRFQQVLEALQDAFARALTGEPIGILAKADAAWRMTEPDISSARLHLETMEPQHYTLDDWMLLVDVLLSTYLPEGVVQDLAEYLAVRAQLLGKVAANLEAHPIPAAPDLSTWAELVPTRFRAIPPRVLTPMELAILRLAKARAALHIGDVRDDTRARMKAIIIEHVQAMTLGQNEGNTAALRTRLFDNFGQLNRDFRRIAVTESGEIHNQGFVAASAGRKVRRQEAYRGACEFCQSINGLVLEVVDPTAPDKDGWKQVWVGKTNVGRSASPRKRVAGALVEREPDELYWPAAGVMHPHCRGSWVLVPDETPAPGADPGFSGWLQERIRAHSPAAAADLGRDRVAAAGEPA